MSKETAKKLIAEMQTNEELRAKIAGITEPAEMVKKAVEAGYDVTLEELIAAEKEFRAEMAQKSDELTMDELEGAAGGQYWQADESSKDGREFNCAISYHGADYQAKTGENCNVRWYCQNTNVAGENPKYDICPVSEY
ncbi:MAG: Nif11-like leader peptide family RiPP precursor [Ruminiclostridium sp.]|nr:Nif11-like leader peptide family RiPP precursor [Ruminiclostridium sp.]